MSKRTNAWRTTTHEPATALEAVRLILADQLGKIRIVDSSQREIYRSITIFDRQRWQHAYIVTMRVRGRVLSQDDIRGAFDVTISLETGFHSYSNGWRRRSMPFEARGFLVLQSTGGDPYPIPLCYNFSKEKLGGWIFKPVKNEKITMKDIHDEDDTRVVERLKRLARTI